jgi:hypothetical protein
MLQTLFDRIHLPARGNDLPDRLILALGTLSLSVAIFGTVAA